MKLLSFLSLIFWSGLVMATDIPPIPKTFELSFGHSKAGYTRLKLEGKTLHYTKFSPSAPEKKLSLSPTPEQWKKFRDSLDAIKIRNWHHSYPNPDVNDGGDWSIRIVYPDLTVSSEGSNAYPREDGTSDTSGKATLPYQAFRKALDGLTGHQGLAF